MQIVWLSLLSVGTNVLALALPLALLQVYDRILPNQSEGSAIVIFSGVFVALVLAGVFRFVRATIFARLSAEQDFHNSMALAETILGSDANEEKGRVALSSSTRARDLHVGQSLIALYDAPFAFIFLALVWFLGGAVVIAPVVIVVLASAALFTGIGTYREVLQKSVEAEAKLAVQTSNLLDRPENAMFLEHSAQRISAFASLRRAQASVSLKLDRFAVLQTDVMQSAGLAATVAIVGVGAASVLTGDMTTGGLAACTLLGSRVLSQTEIVHGVTPIAGHSYPASAENCWKADCPGVPNCFLRIMCATSMPSSVAEAERKDLKPFICLVSFLMNLWSCSMMLLRYLTCNISISQNQPFNKSRQFMLFKPARLAPLLSMTTLSGKPLFWIARLKNAVAAASSRCSDSIKSRVLPNLSMAR